MVAGTASVAFLKRGFWFNYLPIRGMVFCIVGGQPTLVAAFIVHDENLAWSVEVRDESQIVPIWRPDRLQIVGLVSGQTKLFGTISLHYVYLGVAITERNKGDGIAVWRPHRGFVGTFVFGQSGQCNVVLPRAVF